VSGCIPGLWPGRLAHDSNRGGGQGARSTIPRVALRLAAVASILALAVGLALAAGAGSAGAANVEAFPVPTPAAGLSNIVAGPDGALWFNEQNGFSVGRITTSGTVTEYPIPRADYSHGGDGPSTIVSSGGSLWALANVGSTIDAISTAGVATQLYARLNQSATNITPDSAGGVWAASLAGAGGGPVSGGLFRVDPPRGRVRNYRNARFGGQFQPLPMALGANGANWFADGGAAIKWITNAGKVRAVHIHGSGSKVVTSLAFDRKGDLWFTEYVPGGGFAPSTKGAIGEIAAGTTTATLTKLPGNRTPGSLVLGPDGGMWFEWAKGIGRIAPATGATQLVRLGPAYHPSSIAFGSDHQLWFVDPVANDIGRVQTAQLPIGKRTPLPEPRVRLRGGLATVAADGRLRLSCRLSAAAQCSATAKLTAATAHRLRLEPRRSDSAITLGSATRTRHRAGTAKLTIALPTRVAAAFGRAHVTQVPVTVIAKATVVTGRSAKLTRVLTLRR
jgi:virginiamycin B lyase